MDLVPFENTFVTKSHIFVALKKMRDTIKYRTVMKGRYPQKGDLGGFDSNLLNYNNDDCRILLLVVLVYII